LKVAKMNLQELAASLRLTRHYFANFLPIDILLKCFQLTTNKCFDWISLHPFTNALYEKELLKVEFKIPYCRTISNHQSPLRQ
jgi:hypothetical protein